MSKVYYVYILTNKWNTVLYTGVTSNLSRRVTEHKLGTLQNSFTARYKLNKLVWYEIFNSSLEAIENEKRVKDWRREKKLLLIRSLNPQLTDLSDML